MLNSGDVFAGFTIERLLGQGGMGSVYLARHPRLGKLTALKLLNRELVADREIRARFDREADLVAQLDHPSIVEIYDRGVEDGMMWISMQYIDGVDAASVDVTQLPPDRAVQIIEGVAAALDYAHAMGVLHRDVKPANIILARAVAGHGERVFLTDFGIARLREDSTHLTQAGMFTATLAYASPEQMTGGHLDHTSDQYSLACALYWLLIGAGPFDSPHPAELIRGHLQLLPPPVSLRRPGLTPAMDAVITKGMAKRAIDRFPSCTDFAKAARRALTAPAPSVQIPSPPQQSRTSGPTYRPNPAAPQPPAYAPPAYAPPAYPAGAYPPQAAPPAYPPQPYPAPGYAPQPPAPQPGYGVPQQPQQVPPLPQGPPQVPPMPGAVMPPHQATNTPPPQGISPSPPDFAADGEIATDVYPIDAQQDSPEEADTTAYPIEMPPAFVEQPDGAQSDSPSGASSAEPAAAGETPSSSADADETGIPAAEPVIEPEQSGEEASETVPVAPRRPDMTAPYRKGAQAKRVSGADQAEDRAADQDPAAPAPAAPGSAGGGVTAAGTQVAPSARNPATPSAGNPAAPSVDSAAPQPPGMAAPPISGVDESATSAPDGFPGVDESPASAVNTGKAESDTGRKLSGVDEIGPGGNEAATETHGHLTGSPDRAPAVSDTTATRVRHPDSGAFVPTAGAGSAGSGPRSVGADGIESPSAAGLGGAVPLRKGDTGSTGTGGAVSTGAGGAGSAGTGVAGSAGAGGAVSPSGGGTASAGAGGAAIAPPESVAGEAYWGRGPSVPVEGTGPGAVAGPGAAPAGPGFATGELPAFTTGEMPGFSTGEFAPYAGGGAPGGAYSAGPYGNPAGAFGQPTPPRAQQRVDRPGLEQSQVTALVVLAVVVVVVILLAVVVLALTG